MSVFEQIMTLSSFVLALALATLLTFLAKHIRRRVGRFSGAHALWWLITFTMIVSFWLSTFAFQGVTRTSYTTICFIVVQSVALYLQGALVAPDDIQALDLRDYHDENRRSYVAIYILGVLSSTAFTAALLRRHGAEPRIWGSLAPQVLTAGVAASAIFIRSRWVQVGAPVIVLAKELVMIVISARPLVL